MPNRNVESHFALNPGISMQRSRFDMSFGNKTTFNVGALVPLCRPIEVLPGDTFSVSTSKVVRLQTLLKPVMDNLYLDTYWFFVPNRLVWEHWKNFMGENTESAWIPETEYSIPQITFDNVRVDLGDLGDYMGLPVGQMKMSSVSALPFRGYGLIWNEWFRSENVMDPMLVPTGDSDVAYGSGSPYEMVTSGKLLAPACKYFDYFTAALPSPLKHEDVMIPIAGQAPVVTTTEDHSSFGPSDPLRSFVVGQGTTSANVTGSVGGTNQNLYPSNLWVNLEGTSAATINALRTAFQIQRLYERDARGGTRYIEILKSHFGVTSPDSRMQRPEYLGGNRIPLNVSEVTNNTQGESTPLGDLGGMSKTTDIHSDFTHSFTEHGYLFCLGVARYDHSYYQGIHRSWLRKNRLDYYWPVLANLGEQAILRKEIYARAMDASGLEPTENEVFGYQERWAEYRYQPNMITGMFRTNSNSGLDSWHFGDWYESKPTLSANWLIESEVPVNRTLAVTSDVADQLFGDFWFSIKATRCMPVYSIPGLIDHH